MDYHLIGIGGIGMSALARLLVQKGLRVSGTDQMESPLLHSLAKEGVSVSIGHRKEALSPTAQVVYGSAIRPENEEFSAAKSLKMSLVHRSDLLSSLMQDKQGIVVAGSHGKTTTTALLIEVFLEANKDPTFALGGLLSSLGTNARLGKGDHFIAEGDESDGSFLKLPRTAAIVTNIGDDHLDFWKNKEALARAFHQFCRETPLVVWCADDPLLQGKRELSYGFSEKAFWKITNFTTHKEGISFCLNGEMLRIPLFGKHNACNAAGVFVLAEALGISRDKIVAAFEKFQGTKRRLEFCGSKKGIRLYEDYGHHPTEIKATLEALRAKEKERRLVALFQPHRYSRFTHHFEKFLSSFQAADLVLITDVYGAGEAPIGGPTLGEFLEKVPHARYVCREHLIEDVLCHLKPLDTVVLLGAGDLGKSRGALLEGIEKKGKKLKVGLVFGGESNEHTVSHKSAAGWEQALFQDRHELHLFPVGRGGNWGKEERMPSQVLEELKQMDVVVPVLHGPRGEDGMIQGFLETLGIACVGCDYRSAALCMHKVWTKEIAKGVAIPTARFISLDRWSYRRDPPLFWKRVEAELSYPVWVKAVHLGSSLGVTRVKSGEDLSQAIENALAEDDAFLVEEEIVGREIEFSLLGNEHIEVAPPAELLTGGAFYDFEKKYGPQATGVQIPAPIDPILIRLGQDLAKTVYLAAGCQGLARIDFFLDEEGHFWLNEINPFPGFTPSSGYPKMWEAAGLSYSDLLDQLIALALHRKRHRV